MSPLLDSAPSILQRMTVNKPLSLPTNRLDSSYRHDFGGVNYVKAPFTRHSEATRNFRPGYSWPPHLYQEHCESIGGPGPSQEAHAGGSAVILKLANLLRISWAVWISAGACYLSAVLDDNIQWLTALWTIRII